MSTPAQIEANRINSLSSTGPRTPEGKINSSRNATSHGLSSIGDAVLPHEDRGEFENVLEAYVFEFHPASTHEQYLLWEMAGTRWRIARADRLLNIILSGRLDEPVESDAPEQNEANDPEIRIARRMAAKGDPIAKLERHRAAWERAYHRCMREFRAAHKFRAEQASEYDSEQNEPTGESLQPVMPPRQNEPTRGDAKTYVRPEPKIGRNDYCPCGSGLKYKKCCLNEICVTRPAAA